MLGYSDGNIMWCLRKELEVTTYRRILWECLFTPTWLCLYIYNFFSIL